MTPIYVYYFLIVATAIFFVVFFKAFISVVLFHCAFLYLFESTRKLKSIILQRLLVCLHFTLSPLEVVLFRCNLVIIKIIKCAKSDR